MAKQRSTRDRVQGIDSVLDDLVLRASGKKIEEHLETAVTSASLTRSIFGASSIDLEVFDPDRVLLRRSLLASKWDAEIDRLKFRYRGGLSKSGDNLTLTLEDHWIALLREKEGPKRAVRGKGPHQMTRAEFIKMLVEEACGKGLRFYCPQLHRIQPIDSKAKAKKAKEEAKENRGKGIGHVHLTIDGAAVTKPQKELGDMALRIAESYSAPFPVEVALIEALMAESSLGSASPGNVLQGIGAGGAEVADAATEIKNFLTGSGGYGEGGAIGYYKRNPSAAPHKIAQGVQRSEFSDGSNYAKFSDEARRWVEEYGGGDASEDIQITEPYEFVVKKKEDYWSAIKELAKEVNWRAFIVGDVFYYMPEPELFQGMVRLAIDGDSLKDPDSGIENVDFDAEPGHPVTEIEIDALIGQWKPPPASVVTLADHGAASLGFGDAPVKKDKKGNKAGVSQNRVANRTGEGKGRYLVGVIEVPLADDPAQRMATIKAHKPTVPLPEPANETKSISASGAPGNAPKGIAEAIEECDRINAKEYPYSSPGARGTPPPENGPYDCSGVTSRIAFVASGAPSTTLASAELAQSFEPGEGDWLTIYAKGPDGPTGHAFLRINTGKGWRYFGTSSANPGGGAGWIPDSEFSASYLAEFQKRHPKGF